MQSCGRASGRQEKRKYALIIGSEKNFAADGYDRPEHFCVLFGDGAGAAVLVYDEEAEFSFTEAAFPITKCFSAAESAAESRWRDRKCTVLRSARFRSVSALC